MILENCELFLTKLLGIDVSVVDFLEISQKPLTLVRSHLTSLWVSKTVHPSMYHRKGCKITFYLLIWLVDAKGCPIIGHFRAEI